MTILEQDKLVSTLSHVLLDQDIDGIDEDLIQYLAGLLSEGLDDGITEEDVQELMGPFLESVGCPDTLCTCRT